LSSKKKFRKEVGNFVRGKGGGGGNKSPPSQREPEEREATNPRGHREKI